MIFKKMVPFSDYDSMLAWLFSQYPTYQSVGGRAYKPGLASMLRLADICGNPQESLRVIHVAGTNGKGSVASLLAAALSSAGLKTGLYTSPHLVDFRERIKIIL